MGGFLDDGVWLELALGLLNLGLAGMLVLRLRGIVQMTALTRGWLAVLAIFFLLRGADRLLSDVFGWAGTSGEVAVEAVLAVTLVVMIVGVVRITGFVSDTREAGAEYERALRDYKRLMDHRLRNPLTAITGGIATMLAVEVDQSTRRRLLEGMLEAADNLEAVVLAPYGVSAEEAVLEPEVSPAAERSLERLRNVGGAGSA